MQSFEIGYRRLLLKGRLFIDGDVYYNSYRNFIAQIEASVPLTQNEGEIPDDLYERSRQARYRLWTNSKSVVHNYGFEADTKFNLNQKYILGINASYQDLKKTRRDDGLEDGFNTPAWIVNGSVSGSEVVGCVGFMISMKYQSRYYWQSFLINGHVPGMTIFNGSVQYALPKIGVLVTIGASNIFNRYYYSILGGPQIGGMYYTTIRFSPSGTNP